MTRATSHGAPGSDSDAPSLQIVPVAASGSQRGTAVQRRADSASDPGNTLLPTPVANLVSVATRSTGLAVQLGTAIGGYGLDVAKDATLSGLGLGRALLEGVLSRAARTCAAHSRSEPPGAEAEVLLERAVENLRVAMGHVLYWTATGFDMTSTTLSVVSETSQRLLLTLDQFFGSTESSRAMASVITMVRRELANPPPGCHGDRAGVADLLRAVCTLAYLQRSCRALLEEDSRAQEIEETVWDIVGPHNGMRSQADEGLLHRRLSRHSLTAFENAPGLPTLQFEQEIMKSLPDNVQVSITREITASETIRVNVISDGQLIEIEPPRGLELVQEDRAVRREESGGQGEAAYSQFVFRRDWRQGHSTSFEKGGGNVSRVAEQMDDMEPEPLARRASVDRQLSAGLNPTPNGTGTAISRPSSQRCSSLPTPLDSSSRLQDVGTSSGTDGTVKSPHSPPHKRTTSTTAGAVHKDSTRSNENAIALSPSATTVRSGIPSKRPSSTTGLPSARKHRHGRDADPPLKRGGFLSTLRKPMSIFTKSNSSLDVEFGANERMPSRATTIEERPGRERTTATPTPASRQVYMHLRHSSSVSSHLAVPGSVTQSVVSLSESYSILAAEEHRSASAPGDTATPTPTVEEVKPREALAREDGGSRSSHRRVGSHGSSMFLAANTSQLSLVPHYVRRRSTLFGGEEALASLRQAGTLDGMFPERHFLANVARYMRFASASYGSSFLRALGIGTEMPIPRLSDDTPLELRSFAHHTRSDPGSILLCSFVDPQGGSDATGSTNTGVPLVHYISLDHDSRAVVLTCRGTLNFEDVLTDMACDYDDLVWRGKPYKVHRGVHASAKRLLYGGDGRVLYTLKAALDEFPDYGLVLTGHSLGGAVTSVLGILLSEPGRGSVATPFVTSPEPHETRARPDRVCLPANRPIHVYAYGPPATLSPDLRHATRGLITTVVHGADLVPYLSLGALHDLQRAALALKRDAAAGQQADEGLFSCARTIWRTLLASITTGSLNLGGGGSSYDTTDRHEMHTTGGAEQQRWAYDRLTLLRESMAAGGEGDKLVPPGEVFVVESCSITAAATTTAMGSSSSSSSSSSNSNIDDPEISRVDTAVVGPQRPGREREQEAPGQLIARANGGRRRDGGDAPGKTSARRRVVVKYVRDVERRFGEIRFAGSMLLDHSPGRYEAALDVLVAGAGMEGEDG